MLGNFSLLLSGLSFTNGLLNAADGEFQVPAIDGRPGQTSCKHTHTRHGRTIILVIIHFTAYQSRPTDSRTHFVSLVVVPPWPRSRSWCCCGCGCCGGGYIHQIPPIHSFPFPKAEHQQTPNQPRCGLPRPTGQRTRTNNFDKHGKKKATMKKQKADCDLSSESQFRCLTRYVKPCTRIAAPDFSPSFVSEHNTLPQVVAGACLLVLSAGSTPRNPDQGLSNI
ncbi:hypothetical protein LY76DRAFT_162915 [Colletotrichum caudatum]|nr:hypothetical protein LY76DRAFT_162915 [Colletotrichum caudatum]